MNCGIDGATHDFNAIPCGINGAVRQASELWIGVNGATKKVWPTFPVGSQVVIDTVGTGTWVCPASGQWEIEVHGGGGGGASSHGTTQGGMAGGGSGAIFILNLSANASYDYRIGKKGVGGNYGGTGRYSSFADVMVAGGKGKSRGEITSGEGVNIASNGTYGPSGGGLGNEDKPTQKYGNGGGGGLPNTSYYGFDGENGGIILTYKG